jgi:hypothetical protein
MRLYKYGSVLPLIFGHSHYLDLSLEIVHVVIAYRSCNSLYFLVEKFVNILTKKNYYDQSNFGSMLWRRFVEKILQRYGTHTKNLFVQCIVGFISFFNSLV